MRVLLFLLFIHINFAYKWDTGYRPQIDYRTGWPLYLSQENDTLHLIAENFYGYQEFWILILSANTKRLGEFLPAADTLLLINTSLRIPPQEHCPSIMSENCLNKRARRLSSLNTNQIRQEGQTKFVEYIQNEKLIRKDENSLEISLINESPFIFQNWRYICATKRRLENLPFKLRPNKNDTIRIGLDYGKLDCIFATSISGVPGSLIIQVHVQHPDYPLELDNLISLRYSEEDITTLNPLNWDASIPRKSGTFGWFETDFSLPQKLKTTSIISGGKSAKVVIRLTQTITLFSNPSTVWRLQSGALFFTIAGGSTISLSALDASKSQDFYIEIYHQVDSLIYYKIISKKTYKYFGANKNEQVLETRAVNGPPTPLELWNIKPCLIDGLIKYEFSQSDFVLASDGKLYENTISCSKVFTMFKV